MQQDNTKKVGKKDTLEKIVKDYKKALSFLKDKQKQLILEGKLKDQIED
jgi:hypothetical protein